MVTSERLATLLVEAAGLDAEILEIIEASSDSWRVRFEDGDVEVELDPDAGRLYLSIEAGTVNAPDRAVAYETMLGYNLLWRDTGGVRLGLSTERRVFLVADLALGELTAELLAAVLPNVMTKARLWRAFVATGGGPQQSADELATIGIRV